MFPPGISVAAERHLVFSSGWVGGFRTSAHRMGIPVLEIRAVCQLVYGIVTRTQRRLGFIGSVSLLLLLGE